MTRSFRLLSACLVTLAIALASAPAQVRAQASGWSTQPEGAVRLISASKAIGDDDTFMAGLQFRLEKGWKIYWRSPGQAGAPPELTLKNASNVTSATLQWPAPKRFQFAGLSVLGYHDAVTLPLEVKVEDRTKPAVLNADVAYYICKNICIPRTTTLAMTVPPGPRAPSEFSHRIGQALAHVPGTDPAIGLDVKSAALGQVDAKHLTLRVTAHADQPFDAPDLLSEGPEGLEFAAPKASFSDNRHVATFVTPIEAGPGFEAKPGDDVALTLTVVDGDRALEAARTVTLEQGAGADALPVAGAGGAGNGPVAWRQLLAMLGFALLGGLILNVMPCVLPVLSLKVLHVAQMGGQEHAHIRRSFVATAAGILAAFWVLATGVIALKAAGSAVGWGLQFQQPVFIATLAVIVTVFACNLWGFFEIGLPAWAQRAGGQAQGAGLTGDFLSGVLVMVLATPCTAPFLGTAVGFALSRGALEIAAIFTALGLGLALPYLAIALFPRAAALMPKPGPWMVWVKRVLGVALAATAVWLVWLLGFQLSTTAVAVIAVALVALVAVLALRSQARGAIAAAAVAASVALLAVPVAVSAFAARGQGVDVEADTEGDPIDWNAFDTSKIGKLVAGGHIVFVDVTAKWCITCQVNKRVVIHSAGIQKRLEAPRVVAMQADWTNPDTAISNYLASFGRYGVPFNVVYGPKAPDGVVLPELLTENAVLAALDKAGGGDKTAFAPQTRASNTR